jgi:hypothetical protein
MVALYFDSLSLEEPPKKGEHRVGDELVLLAAEYLSHESLLGLLEGATKASPYNFFIRLVFIEKLQATGDVSCALDLYQSLDIKSVQHETLGYLRFRLLHDAAVYPEELSKFLVSHDRFHAQAKSDLVDSVQSAFKHNNFNAVLDFFTFRKALDSSYFAVLRDLAKLDISLSERLDIAALEQHRALLATQWDFDKLVTRHDTGVLYRCGSLFAEGEEAYSSRMATRDVKVYGYRAQFVKLDLALWKALLCLHDKQPQDFAGLLETLGQDLQDEYAGTVYRAARAILSLASLQILPGALAPDNPDALEASFTAELEGTLGALRGLIVDNPLPVMLTRAGLFLSVVGTLSVLIVTLLKPLKTKRKKKAEAPPKNFNQLIGLLCIGAIKTFISSLEALPVACQVQTQLSVQADVVQAVESRLHMSLRERLQRTDSALRRQEGALSVALSGGR